MITYFTGPYHNVSLIFNRKRNSSFLMTYFFPLPLKIPILEIKLKIFPVLGVVGGAIFSCSNYFHVILHGGVGKKGSTIAVRD